MRRSSGFARRCALALVTFAGFAAALWGAGPSATSTAPFKRDWSAHPAIAERSADGSSIYALGDMHGDYDKAVKLLVGAKIITAIPATPNEAKWAAGKNVLVCTGDMIDKWSQGIEVLQMMQALQTGAPGSGGEVIVTLGNHEAEFLASHGDKKKAAEFTAELQARGIDPAEVIAGRDSLALGDWLRNRPVAAKVDGWFFAHAGNTFGMSLKDLQASLQTGIDKDGFGAFVLAQPNSILEARMSPVPWWIMNAAPAATVPSKLPTTSTAGPAMLKNYLTALGCDHMVIGHQPGKISFGDGIERKAGEPFSYMGLLFLIDVGMSRGQADGRPALLKITPGADAHVDVINDSGESKRLWPSQ
jgi:hypothetical protein